MHNLFLKTLLLCSRQESQTLTYSIAVRGMPSLVSGDEARTFNSAMLGVHEELSLIGTLYTSMIQAINIPNSASCSGSVIATKRARNKHGAPHLVVPLGSCSYRPYGAACSRPNEALLPRLRMESTPCSLGTDLTLAITTKPLPRHIGDKQRPTTITSSTL